MIDRPMCAVCNRPVEKIQRWNDDNRQVATFVVGCHGAAEQTEVTYRAGARGISFGAAFQASAVPALPAAGSCTAADLSSCGAA